jgi:hypothetical protein
LTHTPTKIKTRKHNYYNINDIASIIFGVTHIIGYNV